MSVSVATFKEGEDEAGYWPEAKPETHKVILCNERLVLSQRLDLGFPRAFSSRISQDPEGFQQVMPHDRFAALRTARENLSELTGKMLAEKASIDEAYLDFSQPVRDLIIERNPELASCPANSPLGLDTVLPDPPSIDWESLGNIVPVLASKADGSMGEASDDTKDMEEALPPSSSQIEVPSDPVNAWSDYALSLAAELMQKCRTDVLQQLGYTCSAGVARNKVDHKASHPALGFNECFRFSLSCVVHIASRTPR